jgi:excisionase family DNA binding protein
MSEQQPMLLTIPQVMARLQISRHGVYELIRRRKLRSVMIGRCRRIPVTAVEALVNGNASESGRVAQRVGA